MTSKRPQTNQLNIEKINKGGNPKNDNHTQGSVLINQAFSSPING